MTIKLYHLFVSIRSRVSKKISSICHKSFLRPVISIYFCGETSTFNLFEIVYIFLFGLFVLPVEIKNWVKNKFKRIYYKLFLRPIFSIYFWGETSTFTFFDIFYIFLFGLFVLPVEIKNWVKNKFKRIYYKLFLRPIFSIYFWGETSTFTLFDTFYIFLFGLFVLPVSIKSWVKNKFKRIYYKLFLRPIFSIYFAGETTTFNLLDILSFFFESLFLSLSQFLAASRVVPVFLIYINVILIPDYYMVLSRYYLFSDTWLNSDYRPHIESFMEFLAHGSPGAIIFLPLLNAVVCGLFGRFIGWRGASVISTYTALTTCVWTFRLFFIDYSEVFYTQLGITFFLNPYYLFRSENGSECWLLHDWLMEWQVPKGNKTSTMVLGKWIVSDTFEVNWSFLFDTLTITMLAVVTTVSFFVHLYSTSYMKEDPHLTRFLAYLSLFTFFMLILISADNFLQLFLGWEGVGLCSYLLISFWHTRIQANKAAIKAMLINRIGDYTLLLGIVFIYFTFKSVDYATVFVLAPFFLEKKVILFTLSFKIIDLICSLLFIGAMGKSAQIGLHTWLPDAMEGPTPVSALIHAATMVTAGIFLIIRCSPLFEYSPIVLNAITIIGGLTAFFAATIGLVQNDIKKIIAYSTCSQLGYMAFACGTSNYAASLFHLSNHAFFKALLFLGAGAVIHSLGNEQDIRKMGGLIQVMPFTYAMMLIGSLSLVGFPFLSGFYSKDVILELAFAKYTVDSLFTFWLGTLTAMFTSVYSFRLIFLVFINNTGSYKQVMKKVHELPIEMALPLGFLCLGSIFSGYITKDLFIGFGSNFFNTSIFVLPENLILVDAEFIPTYIKLLPTVCSFIGICGALFFYKPLEKWLVYKRFPKLCRVDKSRGYKFVETKHDISAHKLYKFLIHKWYFDHIQNRLIGILILKGSQDIFFKSIDKGFLELFGPLGIIRISLDLSYLFRKMQTGYIYQYTCLLLFHFVLMISLIDLFVKG